jgi:hypothetical protein
VATVRGLAAAERARIAGERAEHARQRAAELHSRREALAAGRNAGEWTIDIARAACADSALRAEQAMHCARIAYTRSGDAHRSAAGVAESLGDAVRAQEHRALAAADDALAAALD